MQYGKVINYHREPERPIMDYKAAVKAVHNVVLERFSDNHPYLATTRGGKQTIILAEQCRKQRIPDINLKFPVGFFFIRGDRGGCGKILSEEVNSSLRYWHLYSDWYIDFFFPGWRKPLLLEEKKSIEKPPYVVQEDGSPLLVFDINVFHNICRSIEALSRWRYSGETDILLVNYYFNPAYVWGTLRRKYPSYTGVLSFKNAITLNVEQMIKKKVASSIDALMHEIISASKKVESPDVWDISNRIGCQRGSKAIWTFLKRKFARKLTDALDEVQPFAVRDLRK